MNILESAIASTKGYTNCNLKCTIRNGVPEFIANLISAGLASEVFMSKKDVSDIIDERQGKEEFISLLYTYQDVYSKGTVIKTKNIDKELNIIRMFIKEFVNSSIQSISFEYDVIILKLGTHVNDVRLTKDSLMSQLQTNFTKQASSEKIKEVLQAVEDIWKN